MPKRKNSASMREALQGTRQRLRAIVENSPIILWLIDLDGVITLCEGKGLESLGFKSGELAGQSIFELCRDYPLILAQVRRALKGEDFTAAMEYKGVIYETRYYPHRDSKSRRGGVIGISTEITERVKAEQLLRRQAAAMKASMDGIAIIADSGRVVYLNDAYAAIYGYERASELLGKSWHRLCGEEDLKRLAAEIMPAVKNQGHWHGEAAGRKKDSTLFPQEISLTRIEGGGLVCVVRDATQRKQAEEDHGRLLKLEQIARTEAEAASRAKDDFLAVVSHELRTPMTAIMGWMKLLRSGELSPKDSERAMNIIERNMQLQSQIIEDLLDISSIVTGKTHIEPEALELKACLQSALETVRAMAEARRVTLEMRVESEPRAAGDAARLQQIFWNLLVNAIKFNNEGGRVVARLWQEEDRACARVEDSGIGIDPGFLPQIFEPFRQAESSLTREHRGLGIGLSIVKHLVELHKGSIEAASPGRGGGATFTVKLPLLKAGSAQLKASAAREASASPPLNLDHTLKRRKIMVVDDEPDSLRLFSMILKQCGAEVLTAGSAREALELLTRERPEALISDIAMPHEDGYSLIRKIRALEASRGGRIMALALTALAKDEDAQRALAEGFQVYLSKPVEPAKLIAAVCGLLEPRV
ncbi:MAG: PAS domain S-box protein [Elusimicrobia bacterium]|nr:PAS domain S-box protein [Elusimicrobiota bacterium]